MTLNWIGIFQIVVILIAATFCIIIIQSFFTSGQHQRSLDRVSELNAERELEQAKLDLVERKQKGIRSGEF